MRIHLPQQEDTIVLIHLSMNFVNSSEHMGCQSMHVEDNHFLTFSS